MATLTDNQIAGEDIDFLLGESGQSFETTGVSPVIVSTIVGSLRVSDAAQLGGVYPETDLELHFKTGAVSLSLGEVIEYQGKKYRIDEIESDPYKALSTLKLSHANP